MRSTGARRCGVALAHVVRCNGGRSFPSSRRAFSDRLLGYSPMAPNPNPANPEARDIPTAQDVTTSGGVWAPTSAKRDKLAELLGELGPLQTLDDVATKEQLLDLWLADGLAAIVRMTDCTTHNHDNDNNNNNKENNDSTHDDIIARVQEWWRTKADTATTPVLHSVTWEEYLRDVSRELERSLATLPPDRVLRNVRDYLDPFTLPQPPGVDPRPVVTDEWTSGLNDDDDHWKTAVVRFRLLLAQATADTLQTAWKTLTTPSDQDVDRAATRGEALSPASTLPLEALHSVLDAFLAGTCHDRVEALWNLLDRDGDGRLDQDEMNLVCSLAIQPVQLALTRLFREALEARPVRAAWDDKDTPLPMGWRQRRSQARETKRLGNMFPKALQRHFVNEVEMPHRLRCIYAWANKTHQNNSIESVMVDESTQGSWSGRKRYVELQPKISLDEFRQVQQEHFTHLDRVGTEFLKSFREDLWVAQGKGRQNRELLRDCTLFMTAVCTVDYIIMIL